MNLHGAPANASPPVDFIVIGAMKALTTSVLATLGGHPGVAVSNPKETEYFVAETGGRRDPAWYASVFEGARVDQLRGEASPQYTFFPVYGGVPARIAAAAPDVRLVYLLRDPVARAVSQWRHARARGVESRPLEQALMLDLRYLMPSMYWLQLQQYLQHFPEEQVLVVDTERLVADPARGLEDICRHIGADPSRAPRELARLNTGEDQSRPSDLARRLRARAVTRGFESRLRHLLPSRAEAAWDRTMAEPNPAVALGADVEERLRAVLASDLAHLRVHLGVDAPCWAS